MLEAGKIVNTHGLRGEVKVVAWTDYPEDFENIEYVYVKRKTGDMKLHISSVKYQKNNLIIKFAEINDIDEAQAYKNQILYVEREMLGPLPDGVYYIADLIGLTVVDENGEEVGTIADVFNTGANDIYDVKRESGKNLLIPVIDEIVKEIDVENGVIRIKMMEGLDEL